MFDWLFKPAQPVINGCSREVKKADSDSSSSQGDKTTRYATREEALAAAKREIDLLIKKEAERNGRK